MDLTYNLTFNGSPVVVNFGIDTINGVGKLFKKPQQYARRIVTCTMLTAFEHKKGSIRLSKLSGVAILHENEPFDLVTGLKVAFGDAIRRIAKPQRTILWAQFMEILKEKNLIKRNNAKTK